MKPTVQSVKGTRDYYPEEMAVRNFLYQTARRVSESFGYQEWDAPFLETIDLYAAKSGEELVKEQAFVFPDRGGDLITLRPELTPSLARLVAQRQKQLVYPLRWWTWGPCWRYERPQKGRTREFFQWNVDLIGVETPQADAEMVAIAATFLREAGLTGEQVNILVNDRKMVGAELEGMQIPSALRQAVFRLIDRREKLSAPDWEANAGEIGLTSGQIDGLKKILADEQLWRKSPELSACFTLIEALGLKQYVRYAPHIVRGLDYYTRTAFEFISGSLGAQNTVLAGGRYDGLVEELGGPSTPGIGFAAGIERLLMAAGEAISLPEEPGSLFIATLGSIARREGFVLAEKIRRAGIPALTDYGERSLKAQMREANRKGAWYAVVLGENELATGEIALRDMRAGTVEIMPISTITDHLQDEYFNQSNMLNNSKINTPKRRRGSRNNDNKNSIL